MEPFLIPYLLVGVFIASMCMKFGRFDRTDADAYAWLLICILWPAVLVWALVIWVADPWPELTWLDYSSGATCTTYPYPRKPCPRCDSGDYTKYAKHRGNPGQG